MIRTGATQRRLCTDGLHVDASVDPIPLEFLELVRALPTADEASETRSEDDRPRKRLKSAEPDIDEVTISRLTLNIVRPIGGEVAYVEELVRQDIGSHVILELRADALAGKSGERQSLVILPRKRSANKTITRTAFALTANQVNNPHLRTVLYVASHVGQSSGRWGDIWCRTTLTVAPHLEDRGSVQLTVDCELKWNATSSLLHLRPRRGLDRALAEHVIDHFFPHCNPAERDQAQQGSLASDASSSSKSSFSPQSFYDAAHVPPTTSRSDAAVLEVPALDATLFPFQQRTVKWMLGREGVGGPRTAEKGAESDERLPFSFTKAEDGDGRPIYVSSLLQVVTRDVEPFQEVERSIRGGILAEEMGLGKTLECIALILLHKREAGDVATLDRRTMVDPESGQELLVSGATLIVTPNSLIGQWMSELRQHAPQLRIVQYEGNHKAGKGDEMLDTLVRSDVVVTTYSTLSHEIHYTEKAPDRKLRAEQKYPTQKSPLVRIHWWRVCLDEAQMIESGVSSAAVVARRIPRANAWGISGTPVKKDIKDLWGLLLFLRYEPFASQYGFWEELCRSHKATFHDLFQKLALRHTKRLVRDEIALPRQHRYVITVPFTAVEEQHYQTLFRQLVHDCGLDVEGNPIEENWDPDDPATLEAMRTALDRLRQTALHPEVGVQNRRALGHRTGGQLRTLEEVLEAMLEQADGAIRTAQRSLLMNQLSQGQLLENSPRVREALAIWDRVRVRAGEIVAECREQLRIEMEKAAEARREKAALLGREPERDNVNEAADDEGGIVNKRVGECRRKLRSALEVEHKAVFFCANAYFQIKTNKDMTEEGSEQFRELERLETEGYDLAKKLRKEILHEAHRKATVLMDKIAATASKQAFATIPEMGQIPYTGLESRATAERLEELGAMLNVQANQLDEWRELAIRLLLLPLVDEERDSVEITGEEYEDSTKMQDELVVYVSVLRATVADRQDTLSGQINERIKYETRTALQMAKNGDGPAPELTLKLFAKRDEVKADPVTKGSLRGVIADLRTLASKLRPDANDGNARARKELFVVQEQLKLAQKQLSEQNKVAVALEQEVDRFTNAMNARVEYCTFGYFRVL